MPRAGGVLEAKLTEDESRQVCRWLGEFRRPMEIPALIQASFQKTVSIQFAYEMLTRHKWQVLIDRYRQEWLIKVYDIPLANKKYRLERLQRLLDHLDKQGELNPKLEQRILHVLTTARHEMEEKPDQHNFFFTNINQLGDEELLQRRTELLKRIQDFSWPKRRMLDATLGNGQQVIEAPGGEAAQDDRGGHGVGDNPNGGPVAGEAAQG